MFSNGIAVLSALAAVLVWLFDADLSRLIQLYVVGVFVALTLSQAGMVRRWWRVRTQGWRWKAAINVVGATTTGLVFGIVVATRFALGAWMVIAALPIVIGQFLLVARHYRAVGTFARHRDARRRRRRERGAVPRARPQPGDA